MRFCRHTRYENARKGFTLIELLVVIMIIMALSGIIVAAVQPSNKQNLASAQRSIQGLIRSASTTAVMRNTPTRVIIYAEVPADMLDSDRMSKSFRFMGIVAWDDVAGLWKPINSGITLPKGLYFIPPGAPTSASSTSPYYSGTLPAAATVLESKDQNGGLSVGTFNFPSEGSPNEDYYYVQFDSNGLLSASEHGNFVSLLVMPGAPDQATGVPTLTSEKIFQVTGIYVRRYGNSVMYSDYDMIP